MKKLIACVMIITMMCTTAVLGDEMTGVENKANVENETTVTPDDGLGLGSGIDLYYDNFSTFDIYIFVFIIILSNAGPTISFQSKYFLKYILYILK